VIGSARPPRHAGAIRLRPRSALAIGLASFLGLVAFFWPFVVDPNRIGATDTAPILFGLLLLLVLAVLVAQIAEGGIDAKALAMLGVLSAVNAALRPLGAGTAGIETVFFLLVLAGRVLGPGFGFTLGTTSLFASALITGGVGPWMPYQMFGCAFVGLGAGLLPRCSGRVELALLGGYGAVSAFAFGFLLNLSFWPFSLDANTGISYRPGASIGTNVHHYLLFDATTSLGWDTGRAITTTTCIVVLGPAVLAALRRAARRASFDPEVTFDAEVTFGPGVTFDPEVPLAPIR
jgi:energy-coupling factor transport system substrate-specific component